MKEQRLRIGIAGGGFITQVMHLPSLMSLADRYEIVGLAEPSRAAREQLATSYGITATYAGHEELLEDAQPDALIVLSPGFTHFEVISAALHAGAHVFTEKPLCLAAQDAWQIARTAEQEQRVVQVGYMKRYDPAYEQLLSTLETQDGAVRLIDGVTYDPGLERYFAPPAMTRGDDISDAFKARGREQRAEQAGRAVGASSDEEIYVYVTVLCDTLVHDINVLRGILSVLGEPEPQVVDSAWWAGGDGLTTTLELRDGARCGLNLLLLPGLQDFREELRIHFDDAVHRLRFPAPYLRHSPTVYERTGMKNGRSHTEGWESWTESFLAELIHFHDCVRLGEAPRTPPQQAAADLELLEQIFKARAASPSGQPPTVG
ncbi:MAG TPA: Gfo/Idh/MocA family oxidoreductase [Solirubrobacteraceae bacterium]|nr:Gfo/Idh/MocA family oxidoreductase [Solirubrobacteraceae bacterium]